ncbi:MAG: protocatechuate 3,4-dioxygenase subunit beta [Cytophagaceae bacterium]|nr:protocatechuate 3,4-dioxygenase subunit beta [Gemmatimonadaceae bacterium]
MTTTIGEIVRGDAAVFPPYLYDAYRATILRAPLLPMVEVPLSIVDRQGPGAAWFPVQPIDADLTRNAGMGGEALGQRIILTGRLLDADGRPVPDALVEVWQANAAGRYIHKNDQWPGPLDPNFLGLGRCRTDANGAYRFLTVRPGAYPWKNHENAWRPAHVHFSVLGRMWSERMITQMYFADDPMLSLDPIYNAVPEAARARLVAAYAHDVTESQWALGWRWDIVIAGSTSTPFEERGNA